MIGFADMLVEMALRRGVEYIIAQPDPVATLASILPGGLDTLRTTLAQRVLTRGILVRAGATLSTDENFRPTMSVALEGGPASSRQPFGFAEEVVETQPDSGTYVKRAYIPSNMIIRVFCLAETRDEVRVLVYLAKSIMLSYSEWLMSDEGQGANIESIAFMSQEDLVPDEHMDLADRAVYITSLAFAAQGLDAIQQLHPPDARVTFAVVAEAGTIVDAEPDADTKTWVQYGVDVQGGMTPEEQ